MGFTSNRVGYESSSTTSRIAAESLSEDQKHKDMINILYEIKKRGEFGAACFELEEILDRPHTTVSARMADLRIRLGLIRKTGRTRKTPSGRPAAVYMLVTN